MDTCIRSADMHVSAYVSKVLRCHALMAVMIMIIAVMMIKTVTMMMLMMTMFSSPVEVQRWLSGLGQTQRNPAQ